MQLNGTSQSAASQAYVSPLNQSFTGSSSDKPHAAIGKSAHHASQVKRIRNARDRNPTSVSFTSSCLPLLSHLLKASQGVQTLRSSHPRVVSLE